MLIRDILSLQLDDPLRGLIPGKAPRTPPRRPLYDAALADTLLAAANESGVRLHEGGVTPAIGPAYETRAEIRMTRSLGAQAASMSTFPESMLLARMGFPSIAMSCITNVVPGDEDRDFEALTHDEVMKTGLKAADSFGELLAAWSRTAFA